jgi:hypothetical protein
MNAAWVILHHLHFVLSMMDDRLAFHSASNCKGAHERAAYGQSVYRITRRLGDRTPGL